MKPGRAGAQRPLAGTMAVADSSAGAGVVSVEPVHLLLVVRLVGSGYALPATAVERILPMAAITPLPDAPPHVVGVLNVGGTILPVVDPRPRLCLPGPPAPRGPDQHLVLVCAGTRYLLWVDRAERTVLAAVLAVIDSGTAVGAVTAGVAQIDGAILPVLSPQALDPGLVFRAPPAEGGR